MRILGSMSTARFSGQALHPTAAFGHTLCLLIDQPKWDFFLKGRSVQSLCQAVLFFATAALTQVFRCYDCAFVCFGSCVSFSFSANFSTACA